MSNTLTGVTGSDLAYSRVWLRFLDPQTERKFTRHALAASMAFIRIYLLAGIMLYMLFGILDRRVGGAAVGTMFFIRYAIACPILFTVFGLTFFKRFERFGQLALAIAMVTSGLGIIAITAIMPAPFNSNYYAGLIMVVIYCGSFIRVDFISTVLISLMLVAAYEVTAIFLNPIPMIDFVSNNFFLSMSTLVGLLSSYIQETQTREGYIAQRVIEAKNETANLLLLESNKANRSKSEFLANMSHELRTPLNAIIGFSDIMDKEAFGPVGNARYAEYVKDISGSGHHLLSIINDILDLAKAEANKLTMDEREVDLVTLISECMRMCEPSAQERNIHVSLDIPRGESIVVRVDAKLILQLILNLVSNAIKFSHSGGAVEIAARLGADRSVLLEVRDEGVGIPRDDIERVMRPFEQVENSYTRHHGGTGLGLPLAVKLAELHNGALWIESEVNVGTTVKVALPQERLVAYHPAEVNADLDIAV